MSPEELAEKYNVPGLSKTREISLSEGEWYLRVSNVGMNIMGSTYKGEPFHTFGPEPFIVPFQDESGEWKAELPPYSRYIGHFGVTSAFDDSEFSQVDPEVIARTVELTSVGVDEKFFFGHHGDNQVVIYDIKREYDEALGCEVIVGERRVSKNEFNPYEFTVRKSIYVLKDELVEVTDFINDSNEPVLASQIYHPYISVPGGQARFQDLSVFIDTKGGHVRTIVYEGKDKKKRDELQLPLPLSQSRNSVVLETAPDREGKRRIVTFHFDGDYNRLNNYPNGEADVVREKASLGIFTPGPNRKELREDMEEKLSLYYQGLRRTVSSLAEAGYDITLLGLPAIGEIDEIEDRVSRQIIKNINNMYSISIEDLTSGGYALRTLEGLQKAIYLRPGENFRTIRSTNVRHS